MKYILLQPFPIILFIILWLNSNPILLAAETYKPFILAEKSTGDLDTKIAQVKAALSHHGFTLLGDYRPYKNTTLIVVTNKALQDTAIKTDYGAYGAIQRIGVVKVKDNIQVSYTNPEYIAHAYNMKGDLKSVSDKLKKALGFVKYYGIKQGFLAAELRKYHYMFGMPYFHQHIQLIQHNNYQQAIEKLEQGLAEKKSGVSKVYRLDIPSKKISIFGVHMTEGMSSDETIMKYIDFKSLKSVAHLPYELLIDHSGKIFMLDPKFRIAISFPDLKMAGNNSFISIMSTPDAIAKALTEVSGGIYHKPGSGEGLGEEDDMDF